jgi:hypothetical protein
LNRRLSGAWGSSDSQELLLAKRGSLQTKKPQTPLSPGTFVEQGLPLRTGRLCVGRRIREMRGDITQAEFAERIGINQTYPLECGKDGNWGGDPALELTRYLKAAFFL